ncbi:cold-shock protein [Lentilactobacillus kisonensis]|uniref:CSD domain-containing protein n=1 Tax=Lentilactobacillus kisonensis DSM 19906 = JCM 15041 TaxID=1423766 RepID=A0A0R1NXB7_9LACO|nr:cold shock domain-containing protein [Lentilactobacillus kisonensis]KRL21571.1 hypothetical protein FC98_GL000747 [Lentilactobacillus kisonensis DSM 19906 = JCM 15041]
MLKGKIKTYSPRNAFGFITQNNGDDDLFFFKNAFPEDQYGTIQIGAQIEYVVVEGQKGPQAAKAHVIEEQE